MPLQILALYDSASPIAFSWSYKAALYLQGGPFILMFTCFLDEERLLKHAKGPFTDRKGMLGYPRGRFG